MQNIFETKKGYIYKIETERVVWDVNLSVHQLYVFSVKQEANSGGARKKAVKLSNVWADDIFPGWTGDSEVQRWSLALLCLKIGLVKGEVGGDAELKANLGVDDIYTLQPQETMKSFAEVEAALQHQLCESDLPKRVGF